MTRSDRNRISASFKRDDFVTLLWASDGQAGNGRCPAAADASAELHRQRNTELPGCPLEVRIGVRGTIDATLETYGDVIAAGTIDGRKVIATRGTRDEIKARVVIWGSERGGKP